MTRTERSHQRPWHWQAQSNEENPINDYTRVITFFGHFLTFDITYDQKIRPNLHF
jgi:hypothetical protein